MPLEVFWICILMIVAGGGGLITARVLRRRLLNPKDEPPGGFSLDDLRKLRNEGKMSDAEYQIAAAQVTRILSKNMPPPATNPNKPGQKRARLGQ
ncbi:MAG TPA: hypothetical protein VL992_03385 [Tepidisphaeraceae bacterium]|nr:hypothetical protein [Tepidisphaeraceae bacterium]